MFQISDLRVHGKFMKDGKATLTFCSAGDQTGHKRRFLINNAPPGDLEKTLRFMGLTFFGKQ